MKRTYLLSKFFTLCLFFEGCSPLKQYEQKTYTWAIPEIEKFKELDTKNDYAPESILFLGSSSIRLWETLKEDMAPMQLIQRGYGGAHFRDLIFYIDTILNQHDLSMIVCFVANDISQKNSNESVKTIVKNYDYVIKRIRKKHPNLPILQISITPTESRWHLWSKINELNMALKDYCASHSKMVFLETTSHFLNAEGLPKKELFRRDKLHLNKEGYSLWNSLIRPQVETILAAQ